MIAVLYMNNILQAQRVTSLQLSSSVNREHTTSTHIFMYMHVDTSFIIVKHVQIFVKNRSKVSRNFVALVVGGNQFIF